MNEDTKDVVEHTPEHRNEYRLTGRAMVSVELESADPQSDRPSTVMVSTTRDVSVHGIRLITEAPLVVGALLPADIVLSAGDLTFRLICEVKWCKPAEASRWQVGLHILESDDTSFPEWVAAVADIMATD